jgi:iron complex outermembrane receptor protein
MKTSSCFVAGTISIAGAGLLWGGCALAASPPVSAAGAGRATLQEIVVTAQKRRQLIQNVGIDISAYTGAQLRQLGIRRAADVGYATPGVFVGGSLAGQSSQFTIRGVSPNDFNDISESPIATYLDGAYIGVAVGQTMTVFDTQRVEILKGPQSTLFGRNATGGVVRYISNQPELNVLKGYVQGSYGQFDSPLTAGEYREDAAINIPMGRKLALRLAGTSTVRNNYIKNLYPKFAPAAGAFGGGSPGVGAGGDLGQNNDYGARAILLYKPSDDLSMSLELNAVHTIAGAGPYTQKATIGIFDSAGRLVNVVNTGPNETRASIGPGGINYGADPGNIGVFTPLTRPTPGGDFFGYIAPPPSTYTESSDFSFGHMDHTGATSATGHVRWNINPDLELTSVTNVSRFYSLQFIDVDAGPGNQLANYHQDHTKQYSQEIRLNGNNGIGQWVTGIYFLRMDNYSNNGLKSPSAGLDIPAMAHLLTDSYSIFGQTEKKLDGPWSLIVGARLDNERKTYDLAQALFVSTNPRLVQPGKPIALFGPPPTFAPYHGTMNSWLWAGKVQLDYRPTRNLLWYLGVNRGVKAGSYNAPLPAGQGAISSYLVPDSAIRYSPEALWNYEGGWKWTGLQDRLLVDGSIYYYNYRNYQAFLFTGVSGAVINRNATNVGADLEVKARPTASLELGAGLSAFHFVVNRVPFSFRTDTIVRNVQPTYAPPVQANLWGRYQLPWRPYDGDLSANAMVNYTDHFYYNLRDFSADSFPSSTSVNLGLSWMSSDGNWTVRLDARNVTDALIPVMGFDLATLCGCNEISYEPPRLVAISVRRDF